MKLNLGCGPKRMAGWVNVDKAAAFRPDQVVDLEEFPWPWPDASVDEILLNHVLEHLGQAPDSFIGVMKELWRVCKPGAPVRVHVPDPRHESFLGDPTHVRPVTLDTLALFSQAFNRLNPNASKITGVICGYRVEEIEDPLIQKVRYLDKLIDELAKGKALEKILRE